MMQHRALAFSSWLTSLWVAVLLASCSGENQKPLAYPGKFEIDEDTAFFGFVNGADVESPNIRFQLHQPPLHGHLELDENSGAISYVPAENFHGVDSFQFRTWDGRAYSEAATVLIVVRPVNDAPFATVIEPQRNSAYAHRSVLPIPIADVDGDPLSIEAWSSDTSVAEVVVDSDSIVVTPVDYGTATIHVSGSDGEYIAKTQFEFVIGDVTRDATVKIENDVPRLVVLRNEAEREVSFKLTFNGHHAFASASEAAEHVQAMDPLFEGETFARKLWRFVRDNTYHHVPLGAEQMWYDMWTTMNSLGWGFCSNVAAVYVEIARAAGYEARVWGLNGHVVPEIRVDGRWEMYDPDMAVYYLGSDRRVAGVEELARNPALITNPIDPVLAEDAQRQSGPYQAWIADFYGSEENNYTNDSTFNVAEPGGSTLITLPPGSELLLSGRWTTNPVGYDGVVPYVIPEYRQAMLQLPPGWIGRLNMPWVLWDVTGSGEVRVAGEQRLVGDPALSAYLKSPGRPITTLEVTSNTDGVNLIFLVNAMWYEILSNNEISLHGKDVWAISIGERVAPESVIVPGPFPEYLRKPKESM